MSFSKGWNCTSCFSECNFSFLKNSLVQINFKLNEKNRMITYEWMNECIYIPHISHIVSRRFTILIEWDRTSAYKGASGCRYQFLFDLTHPPNPCMKCTMKLQIDHHTGNYVPYSFRQVCGFFNAPCWSCYTKDAFVSCILEKCNGCSTEWKVTTVVENISFYEGNRWACDGDSGNAFHK